MPRPRPLPVPAAPRLPAAAETLGPPPRNSGEDRAGTRRKKAHCAAYAGLAKRSAQSGLRAGSPPAL